MYIVMDRFKMTKAGKPAFVLKNILLQVRMKLDYFFSVLTDRKSVV